jgi:Glycosyl hydrolases family 16
MRSSLSFIGLRTLLACSITGAHAGYNLVDTYDASNFFSEFSFFTSSDPTHGFVNYVSKSVSESAGIAAISGSSVYLGVDHTTYYPSSPGRESVRLSSNKAYTHGLFIADVSHMPGSICGVWPAFWTTYTPNWPNSGEIDIIEGVNLQTTDSITLHTAPGCTIDTSGSQSGTVLADSNCNSNDANNGCSVSTTTANAYGSSFNANGGGVYAMQWESSGIYVWFFPRSSIPSDITAGAPVTSNWGLPIVAFNSGSGCNIDSYFANHNIIFDTTFCGDWAGSVWSMSSCASYAATCADFVSANPGAFSEAYWLINSVKVYQQ